MSIIRDFTLYLHAGISVPPVVHVNQYDQGEVWRFTLLEEDGSQYTPSSGALIGVKADGHAIAGVTGTVMGDGRVSITETQQMTAAAGKAVFELTIDGGAHGTANFIVQVEPKPTDSAILSDSDLSIIQEGLNSVTPVVIEEKVSDWLEENFTEPPVDPTLSISNAAADAKVTGDKLTELKTDFAFIEKEITPTMVDGRFIYFDGNEGASSDFASSNYLIIADILTIKKIYSGFAKDYCIGYYDENKTFISMQNVTNIAGVAQWVTLEIPQNAVYLRFDTRKSVVSANNVKVGYSLSAELYEQAIQSYENSSVRIENASMAIGVFDTKEGVVGRSDAFALSDYLPVENVTRIYSALAYDYPIVFYDANKEYIGYWNTGLVMQARTDWYPIEAPSNAKYLRFNDLITTLSVEQVKIELKYNSDLVQAQIDSVNDDGADVAMFDNIAVCGDSFTRCDMYINGAGVQSYKASWGKVIERMRNITVNVYAKGGATIKSFLTDPLCLPKLLNDSPSQLYVICIGLNDYATTLGTVADITNDYTQNPDTFFGNFGRLIDQIQAYAPNSKIIICRTFMVGTYFYEHTAEAISEIADHYDLPLLDTAESTYLTSRDFRYNLLSNHPSAVQQSGMAKAMIKLIGKTIDRYTEYFEDFYLID